MTQLELEDLYFNRCIFSKTTNEIPHGYYFVTACLLSSSYEEENIFGLMPLFTKSESPKWITLRTNDLNWLDEFEILNDEQYKERMENFENF